MKIIDNKMHELFLPFADRIFEHDAIFKKYIKQMIKNAEEEKNEIL